MDPYQFSSHYPQQSRLTDFPHDSPALDQYPKMTEGTINLQRHGRSDQVYASPMAVDTMPLLIYPGTPSTPQYSNLNQYPYDNLRTPPTLDNNYIPMSPHYEVLSSNSSRAVDFGVDPHIARPQRFSEPWLSYPGIQTPSPVPELSRRASTSAVPSSTARRSGSQLQLVPHRQYPPPHSKTKGQYVDDATLQPPILFDLIGSTQRGIAVKDAMNKRYHNLVGRDDPMFEESGSSVALRFEWPGYKSWSRQIKTNDWRKTRRPITRAKLATDVSKSLSLFIQEMENEPADPHNEKWGFGPSLITIEQITLVALEHVSKGSWQPHFYVSV
ncbi:hypothetical protein BDM02DRAFT_3122524 [Thelephora ganbajun]|uniref:Uncharacterized protein n=1 Tax=Thelephora ganbajun TaxID=370292 RepID=A0ACB6Z304_THEGA|nr:hypothetical protein BDM02DRAFT_3122524 [Thelephora ganbajun]